MPTVAGLATNTLKLAEYSHNTTEVLNSERDAAVLFATDADPEPDLEEDATPAPAAEAAIEAAAPRPGARRLSGGPAPLSRPRALRDRTTSASTRPTPPWR